jgi:hypothetical protein
MTITLTPQIEIRLRRRAARTGQDANALVEALILNGLADEASEAELREEYRQLVAVELKGSLSEAQAGRLRQVTQALDDLDRHSPAAEAMFERLDETGRKLDEMLKLLRSLPLAEETP